jgi:predicted RecA/RadA family phage recombinase
MSKIANLAYDKGHVIDYTAGADIAYGDVVSLTTRIGVALEPIANTATGSVAIEGIWELPAITGTAFAVGDALYWDVSESKLTTTSTDNIPAGWATQIKASAAATAFVKIH